MSDFNAKMRIIRFPLGLCPRPRWGAYRAPPDLLAVFKGPTRGWLGSRVVSVLDSVAEGPGRLGSNRSRDAVG